MFFDLLDSPWIWQRRAELTRWLEVLLHQAVHFSPKEGSGEFRAVVQMVLKAIEVVLNPPDTQSGLWLGLVRYSLESNRQDFTISQETAGQTQDREEEDMSIK